MAQRRVSVRKIREILRLHHVAKLGVRAIGRSCGLSHSTVAEVLRRAEAAGLSWPLPEEMDDAALEAALYGPTAPAQTRHPMPDMDHLYRELRSRKGVTLRLLWLEYKQAHPDGYQYSRFCELYRRWAKTLDVSLRQVYRGGEKMFVDFAGETIPVVDPQTGQVRPAYLFVAVLAASNYTFAKPTWAQDLPSWIGGHVDAFEFFGGVPEMVVCDYVPGNIIVEAAAGHTAEVSEGVEVAPDKQGERGSGDELQEHRPRPAQHHAEGPQAHHLEVDLGLLAGLGLEAHGGLRHPRGPQGLQKLLQDAPAAGVAPFSQLPQQHLAVGHAVHTDPFEEVVPERIQLRRPPGTGLRLGYPGVSQVAAHRVAGHPEAISDGPDRLTFVPDTPDGFHLSTP
ncbi:MAG: DDE-type integrase/transposase/recombinase [Limnochordaceae bacterium]|nr:DDE-type integrase/transposase/recombinase [Limnochordaceae bacterium]